MTQCQYKNYTIKVFQFLFKIFLSQIRSVERYKQMKTFLLSDGSTNSYGFRLDMTKLQLERFKSNPVMLYNHGELIGKWDNIKVEDGKLMAEPVFMESENEKLSRQTKERVENDFLKGASLGLNLISVLHVEGEPPIVEAEVYECSIVDIPSNKNAIVLYNDEGQRLEGEALNLALKPIKKNKPKNKTEMKLNADNIKGLGLSAGANETETNQAIADLISKNAELTAKVDTAQKEKITDLINLGIREGRITAEKKETYEKLAATDYDLAKSAIMSFPKKKTLAGKEEEKGGGSDDRSNWTFKEWREKDTVGLLSIKSSDPDRYAEILKK
jgi:hypothetical protein